MYLCIYSWLALPNGKIGKCFFGLFSIAGLRVLSSTTTTAATHWIDWNKSSQIATHGTGQSELCNLLALIEPFQELKWPLLHDIVEVLRWEPDFVGYKSLILMFSLAGIFHVENRCQQGDQNFTSSTIRFSNFPGVLDDDQRHGFVKITRHRSTNLGWEESQLRPFFLALADCRCLSLLSIRFCSFFVGTSLGETHIPLQGGSCWDVGRWSSSSTKGKGQLQCDQLPGLGWRRLGTTLSILNMRNLLVPPGKTKL